FFDRLQIGDNLRDFFVAQVRLRKARHLTKRMSDQIERFLIAPVERNEVRRPGPSSLRAMAPLALAVVHLLAGILGRSSDWPRAHAHHQNETAENHAFYDHSRNLLVVRLPASHPR